MKRFLIFVHIPKTAGTTLIHLLKQNYGDLYQHGGIERNSDRLPDPERLSELQQFLADKVGFGVHMPYGLHEALQVPYTYLTFLREPIARTISHYNFLIRNTPSLSSQSIIPFFRNGNPSRLNMQTRFLAGREVMTMPEIGSAELEKAKLNLRDNIDLLGIVERFDDSIVYLKSQLDWSTPFYLKANQSVRVLKTNTSNYQSLNDEEREYLYEINRYDILLYEYGCQIFEERLQAMGKDFHKSVEHFRIQNSLYYYYAVSRNKFRKVLRSLKS